MKKKLLMSCNQTQNITGACLSVCGMVAPAMPLLFEDNVILHGEKSKDHQRLPVLINKFNTEYRMQNPHRKIRSISIHE